MHANKNSTHCEALTDKHDHILSGDFVPSRPEEKRKAEAPTFRSSKFLRLDESKMPLEKFDSDEYETHGPDEWIALAQKSDMLAHTPKYVSGEWTWARCKVLSYSHSAERYRVAFCDDDGKLTGGGKEVKRLSLRFDIEEKEAFDERKRSANDRREKTKAAVGV